MSTAGAPTIEQLLATAAQAGASMKESLAGRPLTDMVNTNIATLAGLIQLIDGLAGHVQARRATADVRDMALSRIANLGIRGGTELVEQGNWRKIAGELQAIAESALRDEVAMPVPPLATAERAGPRR